MVNDINPETENPEIEFSPFCGSVTRDGITVRVEIYRLAGRGEGWSLEVIDQEVDRPFGTAHLPTIKTLTPSSTEP